MAIPATMATVIKTPLRCLAVLVIVLKKIHSQQRADFDIYLTSGAVSKV